MMGAISAAMTGDVGKQYFMSLADTPDEGEAMYARFSAARASREHEFNPGPG
jgi:hypothetical protein